MRIFTTIFTMLLASHSFAQVSDGFYRVKNNYSERYLYVLDNHGRVDYQGMKAEVGAITPFAGKERSESDPASIIYFEKINGGYRFTSQGTGSYDIAAAPVQLTEGNGKTSGPVGTYRCSASKSGATLYLVDSELNTTYDDGYLATVDVKKIYINKKGLSNGNWHIIPVDEADNYFGLKPTIAINGKYYMSFYAGFGFKPKSSGIKIYKVSTCNEDHVGWEEVTGIIPPATPVIIECSSANPADNKLTLYNTGGEKVTGNMLAGNYFNNVGIDKLNDNQTPFDASTMRVLGVTKEGKLGFVKQVPEKGETVAYLKANTAYLSNTQPMDDELAIVDMAYFNALATIQADKKALDCNVYNLQGVTVRHGSTSTKGLPAGIYIIDGKKVVVR